LLLDLGQIIGAYDGAPHWVICGKSALWATTTNNTDNCRSSCERWKYMCCWSLHYTV